MPVNASPMDLQMPHILLAEDDPVSLAFLREALLGLGWRVHAVCDGEAALESARGERFDALMLDHHLPVLDGDAVLRALRNDAAAASHASLAIAATAEPDPDIHAHLREAGFSRVLLKPLGAADLREVFGQPGGVGADATDGADPALDHEAGLRASGSPQALAALRTLFARDLDVLANDWNSF